jgi:hypothetical protein
MAPFARSRNTPVHTECRGQSGAPACGTDSHLASPAGSPDGRRPPAAPRITALAIQVSFEPSRVADACLAAAYEHVVPHRHRTVGSPAPAASAPLRRRQGGEGCR